MPLRDHIPWIRLTGVERLSKGSQSHFMGIKRREWAEHQPSRSFASCLWMGCEPHSCHHAFPDLTGSLTRTWGATKSLFLKLPLLGVLLLQQHKSIRAVLNVDWNKTGPHGGESVTNTSYLVPSLRLNSSVCLLTTANQPRALFVCPPKCTVG